MISIYAAALIDAFAGDPYWFPHPVRLLGKYIKAYEAFIRHMAKSPASLKTAGIGLTVSTVLLAYFSVYFVLKLALDISPWVFNILNVLFLYTCIAAKGLGTEAVKIYSLLQKDDLTAARVQTSMIVGRDTNNLDECELSRAVVETVAENASDGVIAPLVFMAIGGAPLAMAYKAINTLDSMVGYKSERYLHFGWCSAKLDDMANYLPARLTAILMSLSAVLLGLNFRKSLRTIIRDGRNHSSPNSGYPEAAAAGALGVQLGGTNLYFGKPVYKPTIGENTRALEKKDIIKTVQLMQAAYIIALCVIGIIYYLSR